MSSSTLPLPVPPSVRLDLDGALPMLHVDGTDGWATLSLHGAHVTAWGPHGQPSALWLSPLSRFDERSAIRGGVPVCFPWFGPLAGRPEAPRHGFARTARWALDGADDDGHDVTVRLTLADSEATRGSAWPYRFTAVCTVVVGARLTVSLQVHNTGDQPFGYEAALHSYLAVADVTAVRVDGLEGIDYLDKTAAGVRRPGRRDPLRITRAQDRVYLGVPPAVLVHDPAGGRTVQVTAAGAADVVVWNPGPDGARESVDIDDEGWRTMLCVEAAAVGAGTVELSPGAAHTLATTIGTSPAPATAPTQEDRDPA